MKYLCAINNFLLLLLISQSCSAILFTNINKKLSFMSPVLKPNKTKSQIPKSAKKLWEHFFAKEKYD